MADQIKLGVLIDEGQHRDAIHIAVAPVIAAELLLPGMDIGLLPGSQEQVSRSAKHIGIVDPFLKLQVQPGQRFYMFLYPQTITSLRHEWTHPAFTAEGSATAAVGPAETAVLSREWIEALARRINLTYDRVMRDAASFVESGWAVVQHGSETWRDEFYQDGIAEEFWKHYEILTGTKVEDHSASPYSCSC